MMWNKDKVKMVERIETLIAAGVTIHGDIAFSGGIQIDGRVMGNIIANDGASAVVRITDQGYVKGEIRGPNIVINGKVDGDVYAAEQLELAAQGVVNGNVHYKLIEMVVGSKVNGSLLHLAQEEQPLRLTLETAAGSPPGSRGKGGATAPRSASVKEPVQEPEKEKKDRDQPAVPGEWIAKGEQDQPRVGGN